MTLLYVLLLQLGGSLCIIAEVIVPSLGLLSVTAAGLFFYSYYLLNGSSPSLTPILLLFNLFSVPAVIMYAIKILGNSPMALKTRLKNTPTFGAMVQVKTGEEGLATTALRPSGKARFKSGFFDVISEGTFIDKESPIIVVAVRSNSIIVRQVT